MAIPRVVSYDRYADLTGGLIAQSAAVNIITINGVALVTWWLSNAWIRCAPDVSTGWTLCAAPVATTWTECENV